MPCAGGLLFFMQRYPQTLTFIVFVVFQTLLTNTDKNYIMIMRIRTPRPPARTKKGRDGMNELTTTTNKTNMKILGYIYGSILRVFEGIS